MIGMKSIAKTALALTATGALLSGCGDASSEGGLANGALPRQETLYLSGQQTSAPGSFNPLAESWAASWPVGGRFNLMYEPLITYNSLNGQIEDLLGHLVEELSNNDSIVVDLNPAAKWSDGNPVTSTDVTFMFLRGSINTAEQISAIHVDTLKNGPEGQVTERLAFMVNKKARNNPLTVRDLLQATRIAPSHVFEPMIKEKGLDEVKKMSMDQNPVVSGPYALRSANETKIILERRDDYWGNAALHNGQLPAPKYIVHPIYKNNEHNTIAMREGNLDASQSFIPRINRKAAAGVHTWWDEPPYFRPGAMPMLVINTTKEPLNDKRFRRALATAIDYTALRQFAVSNYTSTLKGGLIMPTDLEGKYIVDEDLGKYGANLAITDDAERLNAVKQMLSEAGFKSVFNADGSLDHMENAKGERLPTLSITSPAGWTDWEAMVTIAVDGMRKAGIDIREGFVDGGAYWPAMGLGNFDLVMHKPVADVTPSLPWSRFNEIMSSRDWTDIGGWAGVNIGRYNKPGSPEYRPEVDQLLSAIPLMTDSTEIAKAYRELNKIFMEDQPSIPLVYLPEQFYEFSDRVWTNWPTAANPYAPAQLPWVASGTKILWNLKLAK
ncbi:MAG: ABC transporter substrate-binding protein [Fibrobacter sp.]|nr:ABC transporter substrate-binding protein [Fibrobacter sp.]